MSILLSLSQPAANEAGLYISSPFAVYAAAVPFRANSSFPHMPLSATAKLLLSFHMEQYEKKPLRIKNNLDSAS